MATSKSTKPAVDETEVAEEATEAEVTPKQLINEGIVKVIDATGIDVQKNRYKAMRAIAYQAFVEAIDAGDFDGLVTRAIANVDALPSGWEIERTAADEAPAKPAAKPAARKAPAAKTATKTAAAKPAATTGRKRPTR